MVHLCALPSRVETVGRQVHAGGAASTGMEAARHGTLPSAPCHPSPVEPYASPSPRDLRVRALRARAMAAALRWRADQDAQRSVALRELARKLEVGARIADMRARERPSARGQA